MTSASDALQCKSGLVCWTFLLHRNSPSSERDDDLLPVVVAGNEALNIGNSIRELLQVSVPDPAP